MKPKNNPFENIKPNQKKSKIIKDRNFITENELDRINHEAFKGNCTYADMVKTFNLKAEKWHEYKLKKLLDKIIIEINKPKNK